MSKLQPVSEIIDPEVRAYAKEATDFLLSKRWCRSVSSLDLGCSIAGIFGVFLAQIKPNHPEIDEQLWVVVGDLPPAYLVCDSAANWQEALAAYVSEMRQWVEAASLGQSVEDLIPVNVPPTKEHASQLATRLDFLHERFITVEAGDVVGDA
ncbi:hypothetical protein [Luteimonas sp. MC1750]|uniref:hypothetical protein n=1 Tax=Luteimonas sp. MC1750 TaxID=2799326 RepID=UPI00190C0277|nr:hypothetical protein [Luteimonas sp. MC1750]MBJ6985755.1 hypothetical protein [Luteimonas sp. MC1750]QQO05922.1 hypothetical protein JGR68_00195 [Luteimonas sp. MC1750]